MKKKKLDKTHLHIKRNFTGETLNQLQLMNHHGPG
jgi:hypothetical protein